MASIDTLLDHVMPKVPRLTVELCRYELMRAAIQFCRTSKVDRRTLAAFDTVANQAHYTLTAPTSTAFVEVLGVVLDGEKPGLSPMKPGDIPADALGQYDRPDAFSTDRGASRLRLIYAPDAVYSVECRVALEPVQSSGVIEDWIGQRHGHDIACGALWNLYATPNKPWTDLTMAAYYKSLFDTASDEALSEAEQGYTAAPTRTRSVFGMR